MGNVNVKEKECICKAIDFIICFILHTSCWKVLMMFAVLKEFKCLAFGALVLKNFKMGFCRERSSRLYQDHRNQTSSPSPFMLPLKMPCPQAKTRVIYLINHKA